MGSVLLLGGGGKQRRRLAVGSVSCPRLAHGALTHMCALALRQDEPFPLLLERQSNPVGGWDEAAAAQVAARGGDAAFQQAAAEALAEARQVGTVAFR